MRYTIKQYIVDKKKRETDYSLSLFGHIAMMFQDIISLYPDYKTQSFRQIHPLQYYR